MTKLADVLGVDVEKASEFLNKTAVSAFVETLHGFGFQIKTAEELAEFQKIAELIDLAAARDKSQASFVKSASDQLQAALGQGVDSADAEATAAYEAAFAKSAELALDPEVAKHVLALVDLQNHGG
jgi:hypothetical protein